MKNAPPNYERTVDPTTEPLTTAEAKTQLRESSSDFDTQIDELVKAARAMVETRTGRGLVDQTWKATLNAFPDGDEIPLSHGPIQSITSVTYLDADENRQTFSSSSYTLDKFGRGFVSLNESANWATGITEQAGSIEVIFVTGYGSASTDIPSDLLSAIRLHVEDLYCGENQHKTREQAIRSLITPYIVR